MFNNANGFTIALGQIDSSGNITGATTTDPLTDPINFQLNKFFYKNIGKNHKWIDRLSWSEEKWINYVSNKNVRTYVFKFNDDCNLFSIVSISSLISFALSFEKISIGETNPSSSYCCSWFEER